MKVAMYCRVSTDSDDQINSLLNQISHYKQVLTNNKNYNPVKCGMLYSKERGSETLNGIFADEGITGTKKKNRKAFEYMMECAKRKEFDLLYVKNIPRFARNVGDGANDIKLLKSYGVTVFFEDGNLSSNKDEAIINILLTMAQEDSRSKSTAIQFGIRKAQEKGKWTSNTPYGYNRVDGYLQVNNKESDIVKQIYNYYVYENWGHNKILRYLNDNKVATKKGGRWYQQHIKNILSNPIYKGTQTTHKTVNKDINIILVEEVQKEDWIVHNKKDLQIINDELWELAQDKNRITTELYTNKHRNSDTNLFSTIVICGNCGGILRRKRKRTKLNQKMVYTGEYEWVCQNNDMYGTNVCNYRNALSENFLLDYCKESISGYRDNKHILEQRFQEYLEIYYKVDTKTKLNNLKEKINELKSTAANRIRLNDKGIINDGELEEFIISYRKDLSNLEEDEHKLKNIDNEVEKARRRYKDFIIYLDKVDINNLKNEHLKKVFAKLEVTTSDMSVYLEHGEGQEDGYEQGGYLNIDKIKSTPFSLYNESKKQLKHLTCEFMFMDKNEADIFSDSLNINDEDKEILIEETI